MSWFWSFLKRHFRIVLPTTKNISEDAAPLENVCMKRKIDCEANCKVCGKLRFDTLYIPFKWTTFNDEAAQIPYKIAASEIRRVMEEAYGMNFETPQEGLSGLDNEGLTAPAPGTDEKVPNSYVILLIVAISGYFVCLCKGWAFGTIIFFALLGIMIGAASSDI